MSLTLAEINARFPLIRSINPALQVEFFEFFNNLNAPFYRDNRDARSEAIENFLSSLPLLPEARWKVKFFHDDLMRYRDATQDGNTPRRDAHSKKKSTRKRAATDARPISPVPNSGDEIVTGGGDGAERSIRDTLQLPTPPATPRARIPDPDVTPGEGVEVAFDMTIHVSRLDFERERVRADRFARVAQAAQARSAELLRRVHEIRLMLDAPEMMTEVEG